MQSSVLAETADAGCVAALDDYVRAVVPFIPPALIGRESLDAVEVVAARLPAATTSHFGFECRLGVPDAGADFTVMTSVAGGGRDILAGHHPTIPRPTVIDNDPRWSRTRNFTSDWADPASPLYDGADFVCLEFDVADGAASAVVPNVFFAQRHGNWIGDDARASDARAVRARATLVRGLELLAGGRLAPATVDALRDCFAAMPA